MSKFILIYIDGILRQNCVMINLIKKHLFGDLNQIERFGFPISLLIVLYGFFLAVINPTYFQAVYTVRNGFVCSLEQMLLFILMIQSLLRCYKLGWVKRDWIVFTTFLFFTLLFFFGFGEKIRWGQFIFDIPINEFFQKNNSQGQMTIHNLHFNGVSINKLVFGLILGIVVAIYSLIYPSLYAKNIKLGTFIGDKLKVPVPRLSQILWYLLLVGIALSIPDPKKGEIVQYAGVWSFTMFFSFPKNSLVD
jgi:hypothetical protein